jgi:hypothetical protein
VSSMYETRKRDLVFEPVRSSTGIATFSGKPPTVTSNGYTSQIVGRQTTTSRDNARYKNHREINKLIRKGAIDLKKFGGTYSVVMEQDAGGEFETTKHEYTGTRLEGRIQRQTGLFSYSYNGPVFAYSSSVGPGDTMWPTPPSDLQRQMEGKGATAIARTIPTNPVAHTAQFLGELREGLPTLPGKHLKRHKFTGAADEFLNVEFGALPLVSDVQDIWRAAEAADKRISQLERDSGRLVRRRYVFPLERTVGAEEVVKNPWPGSPALRTGSTGAYDAITGKLVRVRTTESRMWFSGAYTYLYPKGDNALEKTRRAAANLRSTFGLDLTPELFWELTPWSWAVDWVSNIGDVMTNMSRLSRDNLVLRWGYMMCTWKCTDTYTLTGQSFAGIGSPALTQSFTTIVKKRIKASPYGFALDLGTFSDTQWAILAALGISRGRGQL